MNHTKGLWQIGRNFVSGREESVWTAGREPDCMIAGMSRNFSEEETSANSRLIASAPDLLAACQAYLDAEQELERGLDVPHGALHRASEMARAAVEKAIGES